MRRQVLICYAKPRVEHDGIRAYSGNLARALAANGSDSKIVLRDRYSRWRSAPGAAARSLTTLASETETLVALQYNPFSYSRAVSPGLVAEIARLRKTTALVALVVHEPYVNTGALPERARGELQRVQLQALVRLADQVMITTERWRPRLPRTSRSGAQLTVVGSNLPDRRHDRDLARTELGVDDGGIVCVSFNLKSPQQRLGYAQAALRGIRSAAGHVVHLNVGRDAAQLTVPGVHVVTPGPLPAAALARLLSAGDIFLAPYVDGATTRRTALAAALQHALATVVTAPWDSNAPWSYGGLELASNCAAFADAATRLAASGELRHQASAAARELFERLFDWPVAIAPYARLAGLA